MSRLAPYSYGTEREQRGNGVAAPDRRSRPMERDEPAAAWQPIVQRVALVAAILVEMGLLLVAVIPGSAWESLGYPAEGPIPHALAPLVAGLFYLMPTLTGALCRRWPIAILLASLPAWVDLLVFAVGSAPRLGAFDLVHETVVRGATGTLELFAVLGAFGWLARTALVLAIGDRHQGRQGAGVGR